MRLIKCYIFVLLLLVVVSIPAGADELSIGVIISDVTVICSYSVEIPDAVKLRLEKTLDQTLRQILIEGDTQLIDVYKDMKEQIESSIIEGLNIAFEPKGYAVESLDLTFGPTTVASFVIKPYNRYIQDVVVILDTDNFHPFWSDIFESGFHAVSDKYLTACKPFLIGLPIGAEDQDWAFNLVESDIESISILSDFFDQMKVETSLDFDEISTITVSLTPDAPVIKTLRVRAYSQSMFQLVLDPIKELASSNSSIVVGMPLSWLEDVGPEIESEFVRIIEQDPISRKFWLDSTCRLYFQDQYPETAFLEIKTESSRWFVSAKAMVDVGNNETPDEFEAHLGMMVGDILEIFTQLNFFPDDVRFRSDFGVGFHLFPGNFVGGGWDVNESAGKLYMHQYLTRDMRIEAEVFDKDKGQDQFGITYKPFQFVSFGLFSDGDDDYWLRAAFAF